MRKIVSTTNKKLNLFIMLNRSFHFTLLRTRFFNTRFFVLLNGSELGLGRG